jgi:hypothetical protein
MTAWWKIQSVHMFYLIPSWIRLAPVMKIVQGESRIARSPVSRPVN